MWDRQVVRFDALFMLLCTVFALFWHRFYAENDEFGRVAEQDRSGAASQCPIKPDDVITSH